MLRYIVVAVSFLAAQGRQIPSTKSQECRVVSDQVDQVLDASNGDFRSNSIPVYTEGVNQYVSFSVIGTSLPVKIFLETSKGELRSPDKLSRLSNATMCSGKDRITLDALFQFDLLDLHFDYAKTQLFLAYSQGTLDYKVRPTVNVFIVKTRADCRLDSYSIATTESVDYQFHPKKTSLGGGALPALLEGALRGADTTPLLFFVQEASQHFVTSYFTKAWCESLEMGN